jgi:threonine dehydrogenase-like Zn-dependent dehydrogenase
VKTAVFHGGFDIRVEDVPDPEAGNGQVLVRVRAAGICGSDLHECRRTASGARPPYRTGHELSGGIAAVGPGVVGLVVGQEVAVEPMHLVGCGVCPQCRRGANHICPDRGVREGHPRRSAGFSEYDVADAASVRPLPAGVTLDEAAIADVYGVAVHTFHRIPMRPASTVAILGTGAVALAQGQLARALGAGKVIVIGRRDQPLDRARHCGAADAVVNARRADPVAAVMTMTDGAGADVVLESAGGWSATIEQACAMAAFGGQVGTVGGSTDVVSIEPSTWLRKEIDLRWVNSYSTWDGVSEFEMALDLMASGAVDAGSLLTHRVPLAEIREGFALALDKAGSSATKVLVIP